jgi:release factor glutamine methyltransferase
MDQDKKWLLEEKYKGIPSAEYEADLRRLEAGEPLAYVIGSIPFCHTKIFLESKPLIPRPETEYWTMKAIEDIKFLSASNPRILDLCAGSGCIGVSVLKAIPGTTVDFIEIDPAHHETIQNNISLNGIDPERTKILGGSLFENISGVYDAILTNPPYINPRLRNEVEGSVLKYEPHLALFGGIQGTEIISEILAKAPNFLRADGILYIEHEPEQEAFVREKLPGIESHKDQYGVVRYSTFRKS